MAHNRRGTGQSYMRPSYEICKHCGTRGDGLEHLAVRCTCGAEGVYCTAHSRTDWGEYAGMSCAEVMEREAERQDREEQAEYEERWTR